MSELYQRKLLELAANIPHIGELEAYDARVSVHAKLCGSTLTVDLKMADDTITHFAQQVKACALGQASASAVASLVIGTTAQEMRDLRRTMYAMLKEEGAPPTGKWEILAPLEVVREYPVRHASTLLIFDAIVDAINQIEAKTKAA